MAARGSRGRTTRTHGAAAAGCPEKDSGGALGAGTQTSDALGPGTQTGDALGAETQTGVRGAFGCTQRLGSRASRRCAAAVEVLIGPLALLGGVLDASFFFLLLASPFATNLAPTWLPPGANPATVCTAQYILYCTGEAASAARPHSRRAQWATAVRADHGGSGVVRIRSRLTAGVRNGPPTRTRATGAAVPCTTAPTRARQKAVTPQHVDDLVSIFFLKEPPGQWEGHLSTSGAVRLCWTARRVGSRGKGGRPTRGWAAQPTPTKSTIARSWWRRTSPLLQGGPVGHNAWGGGTAQPCQHPHLHA